MVHQCRLMLPIRKQLSLLFSCVYKYFKPVLDWKNEERTENICPLLSSRDIKPDLDHRHQLKKLSRRTGKALMEMGVRMTWC